MNELNPITRKEMFLAAAAGQDIELPTPITRKEMFLAKIAAGGGSGGSTSAPADWNAEEGEPGYIKNKPSALGGVTSWNDLEDRPLWC